jgi:hypothetical protein
MTKQTHIKVSGVWKEVRVIWEKVSGSWKYCVISWINVASTWKQCKDYTGVLPGATPYLETTGNTGTAPAGERFTGYTWAEINTSADTPNKCSLVDTLNMTAGTTDCTFYLGLHGVKGGTNQMCAATADVRLTITHPVYDTKSNVVASSVSLLDSAKIYIDFDLDSFDWGLHGTDWREDDVANVTIENITYGTYSACP